jgi:hypothetical protein
LEIHWGSRKEAYNRIARILCAITTIDWLITIATFIAVAIEATVFYFQRRLDR